MAQLQKCHDNSGTIKMLVMVLCFLTVLETTQAYVWLNHGGDLNNRRSAIGEVLINPTTVSNLRLRWSFFAGRDISATPALADGRVYFPSWNGNLYAVSAITGRLIWQQNLGALTGLNGTGVVVNVTVSRSTPTVCSNNLLIVGIYGPAYVLALDRSNGNLVWIRELDPRPRVVITMSGTEYLEAFYVGVSSLQEGLPAAQCCNFRGSLVKLSLRSGVILWRTYMLPDNGGQLGGYSGAAVWGSSPAIDMVRRHVYVATGNLYSAPPEVTACQERQNNQTGKPTHPDQCIGPDINFNSIMALDLNSGMVVWSRQLGGYDLFYFACLVPNNPDCPPGPNVDADFGEAPMMLTILFNRRLRDVVVAVQKSGFVWALDRDNGNIVWFNLAGPGGKEGGGIWGAATDGRRIYTNIANGDRKNFTLAPSSQNTTAGGWVALDANSGNILWTTANPSNDTAQGPVSFANGVVFAGSVASNGPIYGMDATTGRILWTYNTGATVYGGISVALGCIYVGSGYSVGLAKFHPTWTPGTSLYAFCVI